MLHEYMQLFTKKSARGELFLSSPLTDRLRYLLMTSCIHAKQDALHFVYLNFCAFMTNQLPQCYAKHSVNSNSKVSVFFYIYYFLLSANTESLVSYVTGEGPLKISGVQFRLGTNLLFHRAVCFAPSSPPWESPRRGSGA